MVKQRKRRSKLDPFHDQIGKVSDRLIAEKAGVSPDAVRMYRQRHKIPSVRAYNKTIATSAPNSAKPTTVTPKRRAPSTSNSQKAFLLRLKSAKTETEWVILASDIVDAAAQAESAKRGEVLALRYLGDVLS